MKFSRARCRMRDLTAVNSENGTLTWAFPTTARLATSDLSQLKRSSNSGRLRAASSQFG